MRAWERRRAGAAMGRPGDRCRAENRRRRISRGRRRRRSCDVDYKLIAGMSSLIIFFATGIYSGYAPIAPGTAGYLVCLPVALCTARPPLVHSVALGLLGVRLLFSRR